MCERHEKIHQDWESSASSLQIGSIEFEKLEKVTLDAIEVTELKTKFYQTPYAKETICIIESRNGSVSVGIARAGRIDIEDRNITPERGMEIAEGRAIKAMKTKKVFIEKNYLRGFHAAEAIKRISINTSFVPMGDI